MTAMPKKKELIKKNLDPVNEETVMQCQPQKPIWKVVAEIGEQIPLTTWEKVPDDASINFKHYLYGESKRNA
jgi:hypothetical protein